MHHRLTDVLHYDEMNESHMGDQREAERRHLFGFDAMGLCFEAATARKVAQLPYSGAEKGGAGPLT